MRYFRLFFVFQILLMMTSCLKDTSLEKVYTCTSYASYIPETVIFKGFVADDLKQIIVWKFQPNTGFSDLIGIDTIDASNAIFKSDTATAGSYSTGFFPLKAYVDYEIIISATQQTYKITEVKGGPAERYYTQEKPCNTSPGSTAQRIYPNYLKLDGRDYTPFNLNVNDYLVCLVH